MQTSALMYTKFQDHVPTQLNSSNSKSSNCYAADKSAKICIRVPLGARNDKKYRLHGQFTSVWDIERLNHTNLGNNIHKVRTQAEKSTLRCGEQLKLSGTTAIYLGVN